jgi:hypothetical protein
MTCVPLSFPRENALQTRCHIKCHGEQPQKNVYRNPIKLDGLLTHLRLSYTLCNIAYAVRRWTGCAK